MEGILTLIGGFVVLVIINIVWRLIVSSLHAAGRTVLGKGKFSENLDASFFGMSELQTRLQDTPLNDDPNSPVIKAVEVKGIFPIQKKTKLQFLVSVLDCTGEPAPVISLLENFQETSSRCYQHGVAIGPMEPSYGFTGWVRVGVVIPEILQAPYSGNRNLQVIVRMVDMDNPPDIDQGFHTGKPEGQLWISGIKFSYNFTDKGYAEAFEHREESYEIAIKLGVAVALSDKSFADAEGEIIKKWILKLLTGKSDDERNRLKSKFNKSFEDAYVLGTSGNLNISDLTSRLNAICERRIKYEAIELCYDVMAADGVMGTDELKFIKNIAESLELNMDEIQKIKDIRIVNIQQPTNTSVKDLLGIDDSWDEARVAKHLREEFQKWNNRLNTLPEGNERDNAQRMLDAIAELRKKQRAS